MICEQPLFFLFHCQAVSHLSLSVSVRLVSVCRYLSVLLSSHTYTSNVVPMGSIILLLSYISSLVYMGMAIEAIFHTSAIFWMFILFFPLLLLLLSLLSVAQYPSFVCASNNIPFTSPAIYPLYSTPLQSPPLLFRVCMLLPLYPLLLPLGSTEQLLGWALPIPIPSYPFHLPSYGCSCTAHPWNPILPPFFLSHGWGTLVVLPPPFLLPSHLPPFPSLYTLATLQFTCPCFDISLSYFHCLSFRLHCPLFLLVHPF